MNGEYAVQMEGVTKVYGQDRIVDGIDLSIGKGEFFVLIGPSGCGKTTTLKMINRLIRPTSGVIRVCGQDVAALDPVGLRRSIGYVIQHVGLLPHMTIRDNITFVLQLKKTPKRVMDMRATELIRLAGLPLDYLGRHPCELSGGEQQRVGVARALAADPEILIMDEPFGAIDPIKRVQLQNELLNLQRTIRKTIIFVTHDMQEAFKLGDRVAVMRSGKITACGTPLDIVRSDDEFVRGFLGRGAVLDVLDLIDVSQVLEPLNDGPAVWRDDGPFCVPGTSVKKAIEEMLRSGCTCLPVRDGSRTVIGQLTFEGCAGLANGVGGGQ